MAKVQKINLAFESTEEVAFSPPTFWQHWQHPSKDLFSVLQRFQENDGSRAEGLDLPLPLTKSHPPINRSFTNNVGMYSKMLWMPLSAQFNMLMPQLSSACDGNT